MEAVADFLGRHRPLLEAHVVNFFKVLLVSPHEFPEARRRIGGFCSLADECSHTLWFGFAQDRMWGLVDAEWTECLRREPVESLLKLPSGCVQVWHHSACTLHDSDLRRVQVRRF
jgi:hypothetical protein